jgi:hypothetical protein
MAIAESGLINSFGVMMAARICACTGIRLFGRGGRLDDLLDVDDLLNVDDC